MRRERWSIVPGVSWHTLPVAVACGAVTFAAVRFGPTLLLDFKTSVDFSPRDSASVTSLLMVGICVVWLILFTGYAVDNVIDMVIDARARRADRREVERKQRARRFRERRYAGLPNGEWRTGQEPARPDVVVNQTA